jgi:hypothetical protein
MPTTMMSGGNPIVAVMHSSRANDQCLLPCLTERQRSRLRGTGHNLWGAVNRREMTPEHRTGSSDSYLIAPWVRPET